METDSGQRDEIETGECSYDGLILSLPFPFLLIQNTEHNNNKYSNL